MATTNTQKQGTGSGSGTVKRKPIFVKVNELKPGTKGHNLTVKGDPGFLMAHQLIRRALGISGASILWYDKPEMRKQRKMGHITVVGPTMSIVEARVKSLLKNEITPCVGIIMGSNSDLPVMKDATKILNGFDVPVEVRIVSAHRTPEQMFSYAKSALEQGIQIIIAGAGGAAHLPGMVAAMTPLPVIGVPVRASALDGLDSLLSIVQMPRGVPVATVAINNATNATLLAVKMLGIGDGQKKEGRKRRSYRRQGGRNRSRASTF